MHQDDQTGSGAPADAAGRRSADVRQTGSVSETEGELAATSEQRTPALLVEGPRRRLTWGGAGDIAPEALLTAPVAPLTARDLLVQRCRARVLRSSRSRPVWRYDVECYDAARGAALRQIVIGKGYLREPGDHVFECLRELWADGFGSDPRLTIPEPVSYVEPFRLLLQGRAPGKTLYLQLDKPTDPLRLVRLSARWLAKLHRSAAASAPRLRVEHEEQKLLNYRDALMRSQPRHAARIGRLAARTLTLLSPLLRAQAPGSVVLTHGDFQPKNIHICRSRVTVIDFDRVALSHPARDVGHFIGQSMTMSFVRTNSFTEIAAWNSAFLDEYGPLAPPGALRGVPAFVARTFLEVLYYKLVVRPVRDPYFVPAWLEECGRWLRQASRGVSRAGGTLA